MLCEWDTKKAAQNVAKHGVPFEYISGICGRRTGWTARTRRDYREERRITIGKIDGRLFVVAYTLRSEVVRLISARKANEREQRQYDEKLST